MKARIKSFGLLACLLAANAVSAQAPKNLSVSSAVPIVPTPPQPTPAPVPLWQQLRQGMTYDETAAALRSVEGIRSVTVKMKKQKPVGLSISYVDSGVSVGPMVAAVTPTFEGDRLASVALLSDDCLSTALAKNSTIEEGLKDKYGHSVSVKVVDNNGVPKDNQKAYWNDQTRILVSWRAHNDAADALSVVGQSGSGTIGKLADAMALSAAKSDLAACPDDRGNRLETTLTYEPQAQFLAEQKAMHDKEAEDKAKARNAL